MQSWGDLEPAWHEAFQLAWEAYGAGTIPVGAVVTGPDGVVLARGRNRMFATSAPPGQIFGSRVAHAEINALVQLGSERRYFDCVLWTTLEPCAQCIGAAWLSTIGRVSFAAGDVYGGASKLIERQIEAADSARSFHMEVEGPLEGSPAASPRCYRLRSFSIAIACTTSWTPFASGGLRWWSSPSGSSSEGKRTSLSTTSCGGPGTIWGPSEIALSACIAGVEAIQSAGDQSETGCLGSRDCSG